MLERLLLTNSMGEIVWFKLGTSWGAAQPFEMEPAASKDLAVAPTIVLIRPLEREGVLHRSKILKEETIRLGATAADWTGWPCRVAHSSNEIIRSIEQSTPDSIIVL